MEFSHITIIMSTHFFNEMMSRNRFEDILLYFFIEFLNILIPGEISSVDGSLLKFKGRLGFRQYMSFKRARFGIKFFGICDNATLNTEIQRLKKSLD